MKLVYRTLMLAALVPFGAGWAQTAPATDAPAPAADGTAPVVAPPPPPPAAPAPPPVPAPKALAVFVAVQGAATGPFDQAKLAEMAKQGQLTAQSMVWKEGMAEWALATGIPEVKQILDASTPKVDVKALLVGTWEGEPQQEPIQWASPGATQTISGATTYGADGSMSFYGNMIIDMNDPNMPPITMLLSGEGTYEVRAMGEKDMVITPNIMVTASGGGMPGTQERVTTPTRYTIIDENTLRHTDSGAISRRIY